MNVDRKLRAMSPERRSKIRARANELIAQETARRRHREPKEKKRCLSPFPVPFSPSGPVRGKGLCLLSGEHAGWYVTARGSCRLTFRPPPGCST